MNDYYNKQIFDTELFGDGFMRLADVLKIFPVSRSHWWAGIQKGIYPQGIKLSPRVTAWRIRDIKALLNSFD